MFPWTFVFWLIMLRLTPWDEIKRWDFMWGGRHSSSLLPHFPIYKLIQSRNIEKRCKSDSMSQRRLLAVDYNFPVSVWAVGLVIISCWKNQRSFYPTVQPFLRTITAVGSERFRIFFSEVPLMCIGGLSQNVVEANAGTERYRSLSSWIFNKTWPNYNPLQITICICSVEVC